MGHKARRLMLGAVAAVALAGAGAGVASGGQREHFPLTVVLQVRTAHGGFAETHNTPDSTSFAECGSNLAMGFCSFETPAGVTAACNTTDPAMIAVIRSMSPDSRFFVQWNASNVCTNILTYAGSRTAVRVP